LVEPNVVLEIAFDAIRRSDRHDSGLALRFPRIKGIRRDKGPGEIDTLRAAQALV
jgi:DNA ligase-1